MELEKIRLRKEANGRATSVLSFLILESRELHNATLWTISSNYDSHRFENSVTQFGTT